MLPTTIYGFADEEAVENAIRERLAGVNADSKEQLADLLGEAIATLIDINSSIPHQSKQRHLISNALENFANNDAS